MAAFSLNRRRQSRWCRVGFHSSCRFSGTRGRLRDNGDCFFFPSRRSVRCEPWRRAPQGRGGIRKREAGRVHQEQRQLRQVSRVARLDGRHRELHASSLTSHINTILIQPTATNQSESSAHQGPAYAWHNVGRLFQVRVLRAALRRGRLFRDLDRLPSVRSHLLRSRSPERPRELHEDHAENRRHSGHAHRRSGTPPKAKLGFSTCLIVFTRRLLSMLCSYRPDLHRVENRLLGRIVLRV